MPKTEKLSLEEIEERCKEFIKRELFNESDSAHDIQHILRVVKNAKEILIEESADSEIVIPATWLHDCV
ncbi:MAG: phosphohydrolase, partial [Bacteroidetes bacterium]|nr:phosphohydrolase [Bacteroidota bacterium]